MERSATTCSSNAPNVTVAGAVRSGISSVVAVDCIHGLLGFGKEVNHINVCIKLVIVLSSLVVVVG